MTKISYINPFFPTPSPLKPLKSNPGGQNLPGDPLIAHSDHRGPVSAQFYGLCCLFLTLFFWDVFEDAPRSLQDSRRSFQDGPKTAQDRRRFTRDSRAPSSHSRFPESSSHSRFPDPGFFLVKIRKNRNHRFFGLPGPK